MRSFWQAALIVVFILAGCVVYETNRRVDLPAPSKITVYQNGQGIEIQPQSKLFKRMTNATEDALQGVSDVYQGMTLPDSPPQTPAIVVELQQPQRIKRLGEAGLEVSRVIVPLSNNFQQTPLLVAGTATTLTPYRTEARSLRHLRRLARESFPN